MFQDFCPSIYVIDFNGNKETGLHDAIALNVLF